MIVAQKQHRWGRAFAGLALLGSAACSDGETGRGPAPATEGEEAALRDAAAMLEEREPAGNVEETTPDETTAP
ncbi:hypothetical protein GCM10023208_19870 [Erythrobacter westpacificensis]|uniref:Uncharacterized protein n=1 Tax=Erythrobacter westpacificensis TaxID=1055231 RepID=A0ABP9KGW3_9SPHN